MLMRKKISIFWLRRDLRLYDNVGLHFALQNASNVLLLFIFDTTIITELPADDPRITFIYNNLKKMHNQLQKHAVSLCIVKGKPVDVWRELLLKYDIVEVYANNDYEPYAIQRDEEVRHCLQDSGVEFKLYKDQVLFEKLEIVKADGLPYTVFTPYKNKWREHFSATLLQDYSINYWHNYLSEDFPFPSLSDLGFSESAITVKPYSLAGIHLYAQQRNFPSIEGTTNLSPHLRFGTVSIREVIRAAGDNDDFINELIWREFFMQILYNFPSVVHSNFRKNYNIVWRNSENDFNRWKQGDTGYPMVDAGMRELIHTGYMHNRVRMVVASFLCKHLLIDWRWGEAYFAEKLQDYELSSNNGNWQWAAGTGCDAAPYFRIFNPTEQVKKFDPNLEYIKKWIPEYDSFSYPQPMVDHTFARKRALETYKNGIL